MRRSVKSTKKALVTGASGLLGLEVVRCLSDSGFDVVGVYNSNPQLADKNYRNLKCDIGDLKSVNFMEWLVDSVRNNKPVNLFNDVYINAISAKSFAGILLKIPMVLERGIIHIGILDRKSTRLN